MVDKMINRNFQRELDNIIEKNISGKRVPKLLLHSCCAPCSSYCLEYLSRYFSITVLFYNPNISSKEEYALRLAEQKRLITEMPFENPVSLLEGEYEPAEFYSLSKGLETCPERGERCHRCYRLRLEYTARLAEELNFDYFATTLTLSPLKDAKALNSIGEELGEKYKVDYLVSDFKKKGGYLRSIELSKEYGLYRQDFCGCVYSAAEARNRKKEHPENT